MQLRKNGSDFRDAMLAAHNPEINWETEEVKIMRCPHLCGGVMTWQNG